MSSSSRPPWEHFKESFALDLAAVEAAVEDRPGLYKGLDPRALYTDIADLYRIMTTTSVSGTWVDLGAGVGESVLLYASLFPEREAIGIELAANRVQAGRDVARRLGLGKARLLEGDLLRCEIPDAETYFLYFPTGPVLDRVLHELRSKERFKHLIAIESHGDLLPRLRKETWLSCAGEVPLTSPRRSPCALIFERVDAPKTLGPHAVSFLERYLLIEDDQGEWIGESLGLEWLRGEEYQLSVPPRTIHWHKVKEVLTLDEIDPRYREALALRRTGKLELVTGTRTYRGELRKIRLRPTFSVEISSGEWVEWSEIKKINRN